MTSPDPAPPDKPLSDSWIERGTLAYRNVSLALFLAGFATFSLLYCVQPLLPQFAEEFSLDAAQSSLALSMSTGLLAVAILCAGPISDACGRRGLMFVSMAGASVLNLLTAFTPSWTAMLVARALEGLVLGGVPAVAMAYLAEEIHPRGLGFSMGLYVGGSAFGGMVGRVGMSYMAEWSSWRVSMGAIGVVDLFAAIGFFMLLPASRRFVPRPGFDAARHWRAWMGHLRTPGLPWLFLAGCLVMGAFVTIYNYAGFRLMAAPFLLSPGQIGLIFTAYVFGMASSSAAGAMADRVGRGPMLVAGALVSLAGLAITLPASLWGMVTGIVVLTIGFFMAQSVASSWVGRLAVGNKGHASSLYLLAYYAGSSVLGSAGGWFWVHAGWGGVVGFTALLFAGALGIAFKLRRLGAVPSRS